jgi:hypothetical protein
LGIFPSAISLISLICGVELESGILPNPGGCKEITLEFPKKLIYSDFKRGGFSLRLPVRGEGLANKCVIAQANMAGTKMP